MTVSIIEVGPFQCRFIEGDDDQCCGKKAWRGSWCEEHRKIVFWTPVPKFKRAAE
jgi:hypothetical protein